MSNAHPYDGSSEFLRRNSVAANVGTSIARPQNRSLPRQSECGCYRKKRALDKRPYRVRRNVSVRSRSRRRIENPTHLRQAERKRQRSITQRQFKFCAPERFLGTSGGASKRLFFGSTRTRFFWRIRGSEKGCQTFFGKEAQGSGRMALFKSAGAERTLRRRKWGLDASPVPAKRTRTHDPQNVRIKTGSAARSIPETVL